MERVQVDGAALNREGAEAVHVGRPESAGLKEVEGPGAMLGDLAAERLVAGQQAEADGDQVGTQAVAVQVVEVAWKVWSAYHQVGVVGG